MVPHMMCSFENDSQYSGTPTSEERQECEGGTLLGTIPLTTVVVLASAAFRYLVFDFVACLAISLV